MREKIERFAKGKFDCGRRTLLLSESRISFSTPVDGQCQGEFVISSGTGKNLKGIVYSSTGRMQVENPSFLSRTVKIRYTFDSRGMYGSEVEEGFFTLVTDAGEYQLPYRVTAQVPPNPEVDNYAYFISADPIEPVYTYEEETRDVVVEIVESEPPEPLSVEEADRLAALILRSRQLLPGQFARLKQAYETHQNRELLSDICSILIKNEMLDKESHDWYRLGVGQEVKITNLFEYFIQSAPEEYPERLPKNVLLYFLYNNTLSVNHKAFVYANVVRYENPESSLFREYRKLIEPFMLEQLLQRKISEDMAVLYEAFLVDSLLTIDFAEALADILFVQKLTCKDRRIRQVQVLYEPLLQPLVYPLKNGAAYIPVYTEKARILLVDSQGNCYLTSVPYTLTCLLKKERYIDRCRELLHYHTGLYLHLCDRMSGGPVASQEDLELCKRALGVSGFTESFRQGIRQEIVRYYLENRELEELDDAFFAAQTEAMLPIDRAKYIELLVMRGMYLKAWDLTRRYGYSLLRPEILVRLAAWQIRERGYERDGYLVKLCYAVFCQHKYNESILEYLAGYYQGNLEGMVSIWQAGMEFEIQLYDLEERILTQMLFTEQPMDCAFEIFVDYEKAGGNSLVSNAYLAYLAHEDFVEDKKIPEKAFAFMETGIAWDMDLPDVCKLSYLRHLAGKRHLSELQQIRAQRLVKDFLYRRIRFGFMKELMERLGRPHTLEDRIFVEYRTNPAHKVVIHYVVETPRVDTCNYVAERIYPGAAGVFVKEFTLFYGERLTYFISETLEDGSERTTEDRTVSGDRREGLETGSKYAQIYEMCRSQEEGNGARLMEQLAEYRKQQYLVETLFGLK